MNVVKRCFGIYQNPLLAVNVNTNLKLIDKQIKTSFSYLHSQKIIFSKRKLFLRLLNINQKRNHMDLKWVIKVFEEKVPHHLAESWDNTGLLIEPSNKTRISTVFFTNDLTEVVLQEAVGVKADLIIAYHPPIFSPMKSLKLSNWKDRIVIKCIENSIAVYSPHTNCDAVQNGVNDWLINCFDLADCQPILTSYESTPKYSHILEASVPPPGEEITKLMNSLPDAEISVDSKSQMFRVKVNKTSLNHIVQLLSDTTNMPSISVSPLNPLPIPGCGMGRIGKLSKILPLGECVKLVKSYLKLDFIRFSQGLFHTYETPISTVAVCAGSGSSVLKGVNAELYITGEMSHHDLLDANHKNVSIVLCEHSNSERGYLSHLVAALKPKLAGINLIISSSDKDPVRIV